MIIVFLILSLVGIASCSQKDLPSGIPNTYTLRTMGFFELNNEAVGENHSGFLFIEESTDLFLNKPKIPDQHDTGSFFVEDPATQKGIPIDLFIEAPPILPKPHNGDSFTQISSLNGGLMVQAILQGEEAAE